MDDGQDGERRQGAALLGATTDTETRRGRLRFEERLLRRLDFVHRLAAVLCEEVEEAGDLTEGVMRTALLEKDRRPDDVSLRAWLARLLRDRLLQDGHSERDDHRNGDDDAEPILLEAVFRARKEARPGGDEGRPGIDSALRSLPLDLREALVLSSVDHFTWAEIAWVQQVSEDEVGHRIRTARRTLHGVVEVEDGAEASLAGADGPEGSADTSRNR